MCIIDNQLHNKMCILLHYLQNTDNLYDIFQFLLELLKCYNLLGIHNIISNYIKCSDYDKEVTYHLISSEFSGSYCFYCYY